MAFDVKNLAMNKPHNPDIPCDTPSYAAFLAKKKDLRKHCKILRIAVLLQIAAIGAVMLPSMLGYIDNGAPGYYSIPRYYFTTPGNSGDRFMDLYKSRIC